MSILPCYYYSIYLFTGHEDDSKFIDPKIATFSQGGAFGQCTFLQISILRNLHADKSWPQLSLFIKTRLNLMSLGSTNHLRVITMSQQLGPKRTCHLMSSSLDEFLGAGENYEQAES